MELVSAAKMRKAQILAVASRPYATLSSELLKNLAAKTGEANHPLINRVTDVEDGPPHAANHPDAGVGAGKILAILITSDRGLAGAFNANVVNKAVRLLKDEEAKMPFVGLQLQRASLQPGFDFITVGRKGAEALRRQGHNIIATFSDKQDARAIAQIAMQDFLAFKYEKVFIIYSEFVSTLVQKPNILQLLPFSSATDAKPQEEFLFEPSADDVLENLVVRAIEFAIYQSLVEAAASEHSARMVAMRNANEAAGDLIDDLSLSYNQARQSGITRELSEISAAKLAMEG